ncbi:MAG: hypothetical protein H6719_18560 [Sandaracinaceae bacterium]|nr:hypothetical protein [Sandaracinaceae bacterium]
MSRLGLALFLLSLAPDLAAAQTCRSVTIASPSPRAAAAQSAASCTNCTDAGQVDITFTFDRDVPCGQFVDGSPWIADDGAGVNVVDISPPVTSDCGAATCNGWMVNVSGNGQALDARLSFDASAVPSIVNPSATTPYVATGGTSLLKAVSFQDEVVGADCSDASVLGSEPRHCLYFAGVLTVLDAAPPDGTGAGYFRPPYVGTDRPLIAVSEARLDRLPSLPTTALGSAPDRDRSEEALCQVPLSFMGTYANQYFKAYLNVDETRGYHGYVSQRLGDHLLRALFDDRTPRMGACLVQRGIDLYHMLLPPVSVAWGPNGGHGQGRTMWPYLAAALLERPDWASAVDAMDRIRFAERSQVYWSPVADPDGAWGDGPGEALYGSYPGAGGIGMCQTAEYFGRCYPDWPGSCNRICADPFGFIDGGSPGTSYQQIFSPAARAFALTARLVPDVGAAWPRDDGHAVFLEYIDRWVAFGEWTDPDPCDRDDPLAASNAADCASGPVGTCTCNPGAGRYVDRHGASPDSGSYGTAFTTEVWGAFRACATDCSCEGMDGLCAPAPEVDAGVVELDASAGTDGGGAGADASTSVGMDGGAAPEPDPGCGCRAGGRRDPSGWLLAIAALGLSMRRRRC